MKFYKILFFNSLIIGSLVTISSYSWMLMWLGMEINLLSFIPLITNNKSIYSSEASMKYFIIQTLASTMLIFSIIILENSFTLTFKLGENSFIMILHSAILMKLGMAPFHFWFPEVMEGMLWTKCLLLLTWQKIAPMVVLMMTLSISLMLVFSMILSSLMSSILGLNQNSLRKILAYSSINHMAWMILSMLNFLSIWMIYFFIYSIMNLNLIMFFSKFKIYWINQINTLKLNFLYKISLMMNFVSLAGLPPFIGFFPKWLTIFSAVYNNMQVISTILIITTLISIYYYLRMIFPILMLKNSTSKMKIFKWKMTFYFFWLNLFFLWTIPIFNTMFF